MQIQKSTKLKCVDGQCPVGVESLKRIALTPKEKRAIFFSLHNYIYEQKRQRAILVEVAT